MKNLLILYLLLFLSLAFFACDNDLATIDAAINEKQIVVEKTKEVELIYSDSAVIRVKIKAPLMLTHLEKVNPYQEFPEGIEVDFYNERQRVTSHLTANYAIRYEKKREIIIRDDVVWQSGKPETLETEELIWNEKDKNVHSNRFVTITTPEDVIYGYGFEANEDFTYWKIDAPQGQMSVEEFEKGLE